MIARMGVAVRRPALGPRPAATGLRSHRSPIGVLRIGRRGVVGAGEVDIDLGGVPEQLVPLGIRDPKLTPVLETQLRERLLLIGRERLNVAIVGLVHPV